MNGAMKKDAYLSKDRKYRYWLWREWDASKPVVAFIGVNPSKADETTDDVTIRKEIEFAKCWKFGAILALNVGAFRNTDPEIWQKAADPIGTENSLTHLKSYLEKFNVEQVIAAWGKNGGRCANECAAIECSIPNLWCLGLNRDGTPKHPSRLAYATARVRYRSGAQK